MPKLLLGLSLLLLSSLLAFSAEFPTPHLPLLALLSRAFAAPGSVLVVVLPATLAAVRYLAPSAGSAAVGGTLAAAALTLAPVTAGVTSWALYLSLGAAGAAAVASALETGYGAPAVSAARRAWALISGLRWTSFLAAAAAAHLSLAVALAFTFFGAQPHVQDSVAQLFHAKILAAGAVAAPAPPVPEAFEYSHLVLREGRWFSLYHVAQPLLLSLALRCAAVPLANPLIGVAGLLGLAHLARSVAGEGVARLAVLLALLSPWWLLMHAELMNHPAALAALTWALVLFVKSGRQGSLLWAIGSGLLFGAAFLVRAYTPLLVGAALLAFAAVRFRRGERRWLLACVLIALAALPAVLLQMRVNQLTTGDPWLPAYVAKFGGGHAPGFHQPPWGPPHTPLLGLRNVLADLNALNRWVLGLSVPLVLLAAGVRRGHLRPAWLATVPLALLAGHFAYWYVDFCFGPRFLFEALPCLLILAACALRELWRAAPARVALLGLAALVFAPAVWLGFRQNYGKAFYGVDDRAASAVATAVPSDALVFIADDYGGYVWRNDPWLREGPVFVRDLGAANARARAAFPARRAFRVEGGRLVPLR